MQSVRTPEAALDRLVPLSSDPRQKRQGLVRLGDVPGLFSEGMEDSHAQWLLLPSLEDLKARLGQIFQHSAD